MREVDAALDPQARAARARLLEAERYAPPPRRPDTPPRLIRRAVAALAHAAADAERRPAAAADYEYRLGELAHLVDGGTPLDEAARRVGIAYGTARRYLHDLQTGKETA